MNIIDPILGIDPLFNLRYIKSNKTRNFGGFFIKFTDNYTKDNITGNDLVNGIYGIELNELIAKYNNDNNWSYEYIGPSSALTTTDIPVWFNTKDEGSYVYYMLRFYLPVDFTNFGNIFSIMYYDNYIKNGPKLLPFLIGGFNTSENRVIGSLNQQRFNQGWNSIEFRLSNKLISFRQIKDFSEIFNYYTMSAINECIKHEKQFEDFIYHSSSNINHSLLTNADIVGSISNKSLSLEDDLISFTNKVQIK